jgi:1,4-dihydroxy-2-naphthoyl-CoA hydrolase
MTQPGFDSQPESPKAMFSYPVTVQLHHTDAYGIIFFANQLVLCHGCFQAYLENAGIPLPPTRAQATELLVIVHVESDYQAPIQLGDKLRIDYHCEKLGSTSVTNHFTLTNQVGVQVGQVRTVHVFIDPVTSQKLQIPAHWHAALSRNTQ